MLFIFVAVVFVVVVAVGVSGYRPPSIGIQAEYERLKRVEPDSPLAQLGPNEFEVAYLKAVQKTKMKVGSFNLLMMFVTLIGTFVAALAGTVADEMLWGGTQILLTYVLGGVAFVAIMVKWFQKTKALKRPVVDVMREQMAVSN